MSKFINGQNKDIANVVEFEDIGHITIKVKRLIKRKGSVRPLMQPYYSIVSPIFN